MLILYGQYILKIQNLSHLGSQPFQNKCFSKPSSWTRMVLLKNREQSAVYFSFWQFEGKGVWLSVAMKPHHLSILRIKPRTSLIYTRSQRGEKFLGLGPNFLVHIGLEYVQLLQRETKVFLPYRGPWVHSLRIWSSINDGSCFSSPPPSPTVLLLKYTCRRQIYFSGVS